MTFNQHAAAALERIYRSLDDMAQNAHMQTKREGEHHRRAMGQRWAWLARQLNVRTR